VINRLPPSILGTEQQGQRLLSQVHRMVGVARDLWGSSVPKQAHLEWVAQDLVQATFEYLQRRRLHSLSGHPVFSTWFCSPRSPPCKRAVPAVSPPGECSAPAAAASRWGRCPGVPPAGAGPEQGAGEGSLPACSGSSALRSSLRNPAGSIPTCCHGSLRELALGLCKPKASTCSSCLGQAELQGCAVRLGDASVTTSQKHITFCYQGGRQGGWMLASWCLWGSGPLVLL